MNTGLLSTMTFTPTWRGVVRIGDTCLVCDRPTPVLGAVGKGRPVDTFGPDYFCHGHAVRQPVVLWCQECGTELDADDVTEQVRELGRFLGICTVCFHDDPVVAQYV